MSRRTAEHGMSAVLLVVVFVIVTGTAAIMLESSLRGQKESGRQRDRALTISGADTAISRYTAALNAGLVNQQTRYQLRRSAYTALGSGGFDSYYGSKIFLHTATVGAKLNANTSNETTVPGPALVRRGNGVGGETDADPWGFDDYYLEGADESAATSSRFTVEERPEDGSPSLYWQVFRVDPLVLAPKSAGTRNTRNIDVVFRTWRAGSDPRYVKASFAAGRFGDYQLLSDEAVHFRKTSGMTMVEFAEYYKTGVPPAATAEVTVRGKVHSNGVSIPADGNAIDGGPLKCKAGTTLSSASGSIALSSSPTCGSDVQDAENGTNISLGSVRDAMEEVDAECAQGGRFAKCFPEGEYDVTIESTRAVIRNRGTGAVVANGIVPLTGSPIGLKFAGDVWVRQSVLASPPSRITLLADSPGSVASIHIVAMPSPFPGWGSFGPPPGVLPPGLIAQGDIVVEAVNTQEGSVPGTKCDGDLSTLVRAAIIAETGTLTVPPKWRSEIRQNATPMCKQFTLFGSMSVRSTPVLNMEWNDGSGLSTPYGYRGRSYEWDETLQSSTPPYFPRSGQWGMSSWNEWNKDCVTASVTLKAGC